MSLAVHLYFHFGSCFYVILVHRRAIMLSVSKSWRFMQELSGGVLFKTEQW
jgi:hypothetical protein